MPIKYARLDKSPRLQRLHTFLLRSGWVTTMEIIVGAQIAAVSVAITELRRNNIDVECKAMGNGIYAYRLVYE